MYELKTKQTTAGVDDFLNGIADERRRADCFAVLDMMKQATGAAPVMWGPSIVGFGKTHYRYATGHEGDWFCVGFSPRKQNLALYLSYGFDDHADLIARLGKHKTGKSCLYINRLSDVDLSVLRELIERTVRGGVGGAA